MSQKEIWNQILSIMWADFLINLVRLIEEDTNEKNMMFSILKPSLDSSMITLTFNTARVVSESDSLHWQLQLYVYVKSDGLISVLKTESWNTNGNNHLSNDKICTLQGAIWDWDVLQIICCYFHHEKGRCVSLLLLMRTSTSLVFQGNIYMYIFLPNYL